MAGANDRELKIIIKADGSVAVNELKLITQSTDLLEKELKKAREELKKVQSELSRVGEKSNKSDKQLAELKTTSENLAKENAKLNKELEKLQRELKIASNQIEATNSKLKSAERGTKDYKAAWADLAMGVNQALETLSKAKQYLNEGWNFAKQGAKFEEARETFLRYANSVGKSSEEILYKLKRASSGTINEMNLIVGASKAMKLGVTSDVDELANLLLIARNKGRSFERETTDAFGDIVDGIGRGTPLILDNIGIRIPAAVKKATEGMGEAEKVAAIMAATLKEGNKELAAMGGLTDSEADSFRQLEASWDNLKNTGGQLISTVFTPLNIALSKTLNITTSLIGKFNSLIEMGHGGGDSIFKGKSNSDLLRMYENSKKEYARTLGILEESKSPANSARRSGTILSDAQIMAANMNFKHAKQSMRAIEKEFERRGNLMIKSAKNTAKDVASAVSEMWDKIIPDFSGKKVRVKTSYTKEVVKDFKDLENQLSRIYLTNRDLPATFENLSENITDAGKSALMFLDATGLGEFEPLHDGLEIATEEAAKLKNMLDDIGLSFEDAFSDSRVKLAEDLMESMQSGLESYVEFINTKDSTSWADAYGGNIVKTLWGAGTSKSLDENGKLKQDLSHIIADAVTRGFANADFSDFTSSLANVLANVLSESVAAKNPVLDAGGSINWGNFGLNLAANYGGRLLTGLFTTKEKGKEAIGQYGNLKNNLQDAVLQTYKTELLPYLGDSRELMDLQESRYLGGASIGWKWKKGWSWGDMSKVKNYSLIDNGGTAALQNVNNAIESAEKHNRSWEMNVEKWAAEGKEMFALTTQLNAVTNALGRAEDLSKNPDFVWSDGSGGSIDLSEDIHNLSMSQIQLQQQIGQRKAGLSSLTAQSFMSYAPWLDFMPAANGEQRYSEGGKLYAASDLGIEDQYNLFNSLQGGLAGRSLDPFLLDMVKQAGQNKYELAELQITDPEKYSEEYNKQLEKELSAIEEIMSRQEEIFTDGAKSFEEQATALEAYEQAMENYHQKKLDMLARDQQKAEEEKRQMQQASQEKLESVLSYVGEMSRDGTTINIANGADKSTILDTMIECFSDEPDVVALLEGMKKNSTNKALWGKTI
jgi:hypothetical protein